MTLILTRWRLNLCHCNNTFILFRLWILAICDVFCEQTDIQGIMRYLSVKTRIMSDSLPIYVSYDMPYNDMFHMICLIWNNDRKNYSYQCVLHDRFKLKKDFDPSYPSLKDVQAVISRKPNDLDFWTFNFRLVRYEERHLVSINLKPGLRSSTEISEIERANWVRNALRFYIQIKSIYQVINSD